MAIYVGIDYGLERTGLAISDPSGNLVFPLALLSLKNFGTRAALLDALCDMARARGAQALVLGLPLSGDGTENPACRVARNVAARLRRRIDLPIFLMPEFLSSDAALHDLREAGLKGRKIKAALDQQAACRILESFLAQPEQRRMRI